MIIRELYNCTPFEIWGAVYGLVPMERRAIRIVEFNERCDLCMSGHYKECYFFLDRSRGFRWFQSHPKNTLARIEYIPVTGLFNLVIYEDITKS